MSKKGKEWRARKKARDPIGWNLRNRQKKKARLARQKARDPVTFRAKMAARARRKNANAKARDIEGYRAKKAAAFRRYYAASLAKNPEKLRADSRAWNLAYRARQRLLNPPRRLLTDEERRDRRRLYRHARRARKRGNGGKPSLGVKARLTQLQHGKCIYCRQSLVNPVIDHILPLALGGSSDNSNLQLLCGLCNNKKGAYHPVEFAQKVGMLL